MGCIASGVRDVIQDGRKDCRHLGFYNKYKFAGKMRKFQICFPRVVQYDRNKHFAAFGSILYGFSLKKGAKHAFLFKNGLT